MAGFDPNEFKEWKIKWKAELRYTISWKRKAEESDVEQVVAKKKILEDLDCGYFGNLDGNELQRQITEYGRLQQERIDRQKVNERIQKDRRIENKEAYDQVINSINENEFLKDELKNSWRDSFTKNFDYFFETNIAMFVCRVPGVTAYRMGLKLFMSLANKDGLLNDYILDWIIALQCKDSSSVQYIETSVTDLLKSDDKSGIQRFETDKDCAMGIYNQGNVHWVFYMFDKRTRHLFVVDPLVDYVRQDIANDLLQGFTEVHHGAGSECGGKRSREKHFCDAKPEEWNFEDRWTVQTIQHTKQTDGKSCGLFCIEFATSAIKSYPVIPNFLEVDKDVYKLRRKYAATVMKSAKKLH